MSKLRHRFEASLLSSMVPPVTHRFDSDEPEKILVIRRNRIGDMVCTLPLLHMLRKRYPHCAIDVACEESGAPIARASGVTRNVIVLKKGLTRWHGMIMNARKLRGYDIAIGVKAGFDRRLAMLTLLSQAPIRIGYEDLPLGEESLYYTAALKPPAPDEHQVDSCVKLLGPLGIIPEKIDFSLKLPEESVQFAEKYLNGANFKKYNGLAILNISSTHPLKLPDAVFMNLAKRLATKAGYLVAIASAPKDRQRASAVVGSAQCEAVAMLETEGILDFAAVLKKANFIFTPEGGSGHLAAALDVPALVFWSGGPFVKWHTRSVNHRHMHVDSFSAVISTDDVWPIIEEDFLQKTHA